MTFSQQLLRSLMGLLAGLMLMLSAVIGFQVFTTQSQDSVAQNVFVPEQRVDRLVAIAEAIRQPLQSADQIRALSFEQSCSPRQVRLLTGRLIDKMGIVSVADAQLRLNAAFEAATAVAPMGCRGFLAEVDLLLRQPTLLDTTPTPSLTFRIAQAVTERVSWDSVPPCLFTRDQSRAFYLRGPQGYCLDGVVGLSSQLSSSDAIRPLAQVVYARMLAPLSVSGSVGQAQRFVLTSDHRVQESIDRAALCFLGSGPCQGSSWPVPVQDQGATIVVMNAQTGEVLGQTCLGAPCQSSAWNDANPLAAFLAEAPPASVAKLFFSLALSEQGEGGRELLLQIKTSGQRDASVTKRNEWWERTAICDLKDRPPGAEPHACSLPARVEALASRLLWAGRCPTPGPQCGRVPLGIDAMDLSGFLGILMPTSAASTTPTASREYLNWRQYDAIRRSGGVTQIARPYQETSAAVQSVLGAAESRASALGIASLVTGIYQISLGKAPVRPRLLNRLADMPSEAVSRPSGPQISPRLVLAARQVRSGMVKVMTPAEAGWQGDGTGSAAFRSVFGRSCPDDCPVEGKTGTVSARDPRFAGTTTFAGLVETAALGRFRNAGLPDADQSQGLKGKLPPVLAIGVISFSSQPRAGSAGHAASQLAMEFLGDLMAPSVASEKPEKVSP